jgi:SPP1 family predicted phage head-tail adaptor
MVTDDQPVTIGQMRDMVVFAKYSSVINTTTGLSEDQLTEFERAYAAIRPIGTTQFYQGYSTETEISHAIYVRFRSDVNSGMYDRIIQRAIIETGQTQELVFEIIRSTPWNGMRIFTRFDVRQVSEKIL